MTKTEINNVCDMFEENVSDSGLERNLWLHRTLPDRRRSLVVDWKNGLYVDWTSRGRCVDHEELDWELLRAARAAGYRGVITVHLHDAVAMDSFEYDLDVD